jgi:hypothetical protein
MKAYWGVYVKLYAFLTSTLDGGEWSASRSSRFNHRERTPGTHWIGDWVGPRAGLDTVVKRKIPCPCRDTNPPIIQPVAQRYTAELSHVIIYTSQCETQGEPVRGSAAALFAIRYSEKLANR